MKYNKILIVDDSATSRMIIKRCIQIAGFENASFLEADNGLQALSLIAQNSFDIIFTDLNMPRMDGLNMIKKIRSSNCAVPIYCISSSTASIDKQNLTDYGINGLIDKPVSPVKILSAIGKNE